jgi:hypothetical protein
MRLLIIAFGSSIHTARWIAAVKDQGWDIHLFPVDPYYLHPEIEGVTVHYLFRKSRSAINPAVVQSAMPWPFIVGKRTIQSLSQKLGTNPLSDQARLVNTIKKIKPDVIHSMDQVGGILTYEARSRFTGDFPPWVHFSWGLDLAFTGRDPDQYDKISKVMQSCNYFMADCQREIDIAHEYGFKGQSFGVFSGAAGFPIDQWRSYRQPGKVSDRKIIAIKGRHGSQGIIVYLPHGAATSSSDTNVSGAVEFVRYASNLDISVLPANTPHDKIISLFGSARIAVSLGLMDGTPHSLLESLIMGAYPIQSSAADTRGWIEHGINGHVVPADDIGLIIGALKDALLNDQLVDNAEVINLRLMKEKRDLSVVKPQVVDMYRRAAQKK